MCFVQICGILCTLQIKFSNMPRVRVRVRIRVRVRVRVKVRVRVRFRRDENPCFP